MAQAAQSQQQSLSQKQAKSRAGAIVDDDEALAKDLKQQQDREAQQRALQAAEEKAMREQKAKAEQAAKDQAARE